MRAEHLPVGKGKIDWYEFFRVLKSMNYEGYLGLDLSSNDSIIEDFKQSVEYISKVANDLDIDISW